MRVAAPFNAAIVDKFRFCGSTRSVGQRLGIALESARPGDCGADFMQSLRREPGRSKPLLSFGKIVGHWKSDNDGAGAGRTFALAKRAAISACR